VSYLVHLLVPPRNAAPRLRIRASPAPPLKLARPCPSSPPSPGPRVQYRLGTRYTE